MLLNTLAILSLSACLPVAISAPILDNNNATSATPSVFTSQHTNSTNTPLSNSTPHQSFGVEVESSSDGIFVYPSSSSETASSQADSTSTKRPLVMAYYPSWAEGNYSPETIDYGLYDWIDFAFATPDEHFNLTWDDAASDLLARLVNFAHGNSTKVKLSIGGWGGSRWFSTAISTEVNQQVFAGNIVNFYYVYGLDGIDLDWEYPGRKGESGNQVSPSDSANYLQFLGLLRKMLPTGAFLTAAVDHTPFVDGVGVPLKDVSAFAQLLDWILIMNYDVWSASQNPGPNAPLSDRCRNSTQPDANAEAAINAWTAAGFDPYQLVLGIPAYGILSTSNATKLRTRSKRGSPTLVTDDGEKQGQTRFCSLIKQGALVPEDAQGQQKFVGSSGFTRHWDECSSTPFLRSADTNQLVSYDDPESIGLKAEFVKKNEMRGINMWELTGDTLDNILINAVRANLYGY
ncbi:glycoside hydrolase family 18 protein [Armillaria fumosa]|nr:glycoside hydrolase family 18 protein [Armillaria fumosa]